MNKFQKLKLSIIFKHAAANKMISNIPDYIYNKLRYRYHNGLPVSFYFFFKRIPGNCSVLRNLLLTKVFEDNEDYRIVSADLDIIGDHVYVECDGMVYDVDNNLLTSIDFYNRVFKPKNVSFVNKDSIDSYMKENMTDGLLEDVYDISLSILDDINDQYEAYNGKHQALLDRQVNSFFNDIGYDDGLLIEDLKRLH